MRNGCGGNSEKLRKSCGGNAEWRNQCPQHKQINTRDETPAAVTAVTVLRTPCVGGAASLGGGAAVQRIREKGGCASRRDARDGRGSGRCKGRARRAGGEPGEPGEPVEPVEPVEPGEPGERSASAGRFPFQSHAPT